MALAHLCDKRVQAMAQRDMEIRKQALLAQGTNQTTIIEEQKDNSPPLPDIPARIEVMNAVAGSYN
ncbi:hypothetical protein GN244_ATG20887 [Phytophthora infestans]|uniref:Uncharacterized protein n=1 Tax=Phytophthora infestans TaxID=4787 RepID=A0A833W2V2_PHYIN|nr:hypothetical protein GN244_ATG20887 [Phytophthora infestans]